MYAAMAPVTTGVANDVPLHWARPVKFRTSPRVRRLVAGVGAGRERVDEVAAVGVDVDPLPVVGEVGHLAVGVQRADADHPVERRRVERTSLPSLPAAATTSGPSSRSFRRYASASAWKPISGEVPAGVRARRDRDELRLVLVAHRLVELLGDLRLVDRPALGEEPLDLDLGGGSQAPDDAGHEGAVPGVRVDRRRGRRSRRRRRRPRRATDCPRRWRRLAYQPVSTTETRTPLPAPASLLSAGSGPPLLGGSSGSVAGQAFPVFRRRRGCGPVRRRPRPARGRAPRACRACRSSPSVIRGGSR